MYLFQFSTCFEQPRAHHQENQLYQYNIWYMSLFVGDRFLCRSELHTKRSPTQSDIYQMLYWYNWFSWWWARGCSKHVGNWNKYEYIGKNCASIWSFTKNHDKMHGQQYIKFCFGLIYRISDCYARQVQIVIKGLNNRHIWDLNFSQRCWSFQVV